MTELKKEITIMIGILLLSYVLVFLLASKDITDYTIADTEYWRETGNRLMLKTAYDYNNKEDIKAFPNVLGNWKGFDFKYSNRTYEKLNAEVMLSKAFSNPNGDVIWMDIINSRTGESFHKQKICVEGAGWTINNETIAEFKIASNSNSNPYTKLYTNRLDVSKKDRSQVMLYWFMFKKFGSNDAVTMIRISAEVRNNDTAKTFEYTKAFVEEQLFNAMYEKSATNSVTNAEHIVQQYGIKGMLAIISILLIPIGLIIVGVRKKE